MGVVSLLGYYGRIYSSVGRTLTAKTSRTRGPIYFEKLSWAVQCGIRIAEASSLTGLWVIFRKFNNRSVVYSE